MGSIDPGTSATRPGGTATVGGVTVGGDEVGGVIVGVVVDVGEDLLDPPLQAPHTATITAANAQKGLQARSGRVDPKVMAEARFYPDVETRPSQADLAARVAELERVVATLASLRRERPLDDRPDPVALTRALHPGGMRSTFRAKPRATSGGTIPLRFVLFDPSTSR